MSGTLAFRPLPGARLNMAHPLARNMVGCWLLNENGGVRAMDLSPSSAHGALTGFGSPPRRGFNGLQFTAATPSYIEIPASFTQLNFTSEDFSIIARINIDDLSTMRTIFIRGDRNIDGYGFFIASGGGLLLRTYQSTAEQVSTSFAGDIVTGNDYTVGLSRVGASVTLFKNGGDATDASGTHIDPATSTKTPKIGVRHNKTSDPFDGKMEFLYIWGKRRLTLLEHQAVYASPYNPMGIPLFV